MSTIAQSSEETSRVGGPAFLKSTRVVSSSEVLGGEPVFRGTRIPLQHVASLFRKGVPEQEIAEDFPNLSARDFAHARLFARFGEKPGRPRKRLVIQRKHGAAELLVCCWMSISRRRWDPLRI